MNWKAKLSLASALLVPIVLVVTLYIWWTQPFTSLPQSDLFLQKVSNGQQNEHQLIPNLQEATIYVLDRPHAPEELKSPEDLARSNRVRQFTISTNDQGLRNPAITAKHKFRILCVGESVTFGWGVTAEASYPAQLQKILEVEVINAGTPSARIEHSSKWIQNQAEKLQPDLILLTGRPDWLHPHAINSFSTSIRNAQRYIKPVPIALILPPLSSFDRQGLENLEQEQQQIKQSLRNVPVLDLSEQFMQHEATSGVRLQIEGEQQQLVNVATGEVIVRAENTPLQPGHPVLAPEIIAAFENDPQLREPLIFDGGHPDEEGFVLFAQLVADWLKEQRLVP